jgi:hypothetical protein
MKKLIVLSAILLAGTLSVTSCDKKVEPQHEGEPTQTTVDTVAQTEADTTAAATATADTLTQK